MKRKKEIQVIMLHKCYDKSKSRKKKGMKWNDINKFENEL